MPNLDLVKQHKKFVPFVAATVLRNMAAPYRREYKGKIPAPHGAGDNLYYKVMGLGLTHLVAQGGQSVKPVHSRLRYLRRRCCWSCGSCCYYRV